MTPDLREFLVSQPWVAKIGVRRLNGTLHVQPVWYSVDGDQIVMVISANSLAGRCIRRERRVAMCVDDTRLPYAFASIEGPVDIDDDQTSASFWEEDAIRRYRDDVTDPAAHAAFLLTYGVYVARLTPESVYFTPVVSPPPANTTREPQP